jgi:phosphatidylglycerol---prolipoprotein diacylglyceryl transferase
VWPIVFQIGPFTLHSYGLLVAGGFLAGYLMLLRLAQRHSVPQPVVADLAWVALLGGIVGARVLYVLFNIGFYLKAPLEILKFWEGGLVWYGGLIGAVAAGIYFVRRKGVSVLDTADAAAPGVALGQAIGRLGCFAAGCCYGKESSVPWAVTFSSPHALAPLGAPLHPSQLYEAALLFALSGVLFLAGPRIRAAFGSGAVALWYVEAAAFIRIGVEFTRGDERGPVLFGMTSTQWIAGAFLVIASAAWAVLGVRKAAAKRLSS